MSADLIVYATGYHAANQGIAKLISPEVAAKVGKDRVKQRALPGNKSAPLELQNSQPLRRAPGVGECQIQPPDCGFSSSFAVKQLSDLTH